MGRRLALEACDAQGGGWGLRAVRLRGIGNRLVEEEGPARQFAGFGTWGQGPVGQGVGTGPGNSVLLRRRAQVAHVGGTGAGEEREQRRDRGSGARMRELWN